MEGNKDPGGGGGEGDRREQGSELRKKFEKRFQRIESNMRREEELKKCIEEKEAGIEQLLRKREQ